MTQRTCTFPECTKSYYAAGLCRGHYSQKQRGSELRPLQARLAPGMPLLERIKFRTVVTASGCWEYTGCLNSTGYGSINYDGKPQLAHRVVYSVAKHPIGPEDVVRHTCDNPPCVNPSHLIVGTQGDNVRDAVDRDRMPRGENSAVHKLTDAQCDEIRRLHACGVPLVEISRRFPQVRRGSVYRIATGTRRAKPTNVPKVA